MLSGPQIIVVLSCMGGPVATHWPHTLRLPKASPRPTSSETSDQHLIETGMKRYKSMRYGFGDGVQFSDCNLTDGVVSEISGMLV